MKQLLKRKLFQIGLWPALDLTRRLPEIRSYLNEGLTGPAPPPVKRKVLSSYLRKYNLRRFVETGTHLGDTLACIAQDPNIQCTSIELAEAYFSKAQARFSSNDNVQVLHGDSGVLLPALVKELDEPSMFWLDGHWSGGETGRADQDTPISTELDAVLESPVKDHVILIDDARCLDGTNGYPHLDELLRTVREQSSYACEVSADIIRLTP